GMAALAGGGDADPAARPAGHRVAALAGEPTMVAVEPEPGGAVIERRGWRRRQRCVAAMVLLVAAGARLGPDPRVGADALRDPLGERCVARQALARRDAAERDVAAAALRLQRGVGSGELAGRHGAEIGARGRCGERETHAHGERTPDHQPAPIWASART